MPWWSRTDGFMTVHLLMEIKQLLWDPCNPSSKTFKSSDICQSHVLILSYVFAFAGQKLVLSIFLQLTSVAPKLQSSWLQSPSRVSHIYWKEEIFSSAPDTFFSGNCPASSWALAACCPWCWFWPSSTPCAWTSRAWFWRRRCGSKRCCVPSASRTGPCGPPGSQKTLLCSWFPVRS